MAETVLTTGAGTATYTSAPNGIDCTGSCVGYFVPGSAVTLNVMAATPGPLAVTPTVTVPRSDRS